MENRETKVNVNEVLEAMKQYEINEIDDKYKSLNVRRNVKDVFKYVENAEDEKYLLENLDALVELSSGAVGIDENLVRTHVFINRNYSFKYNITVEESEEIAGEILMDGITICQNHILYTDQEELMKMAKRIVENQVGNLKYLKKFLSSEELAKLWVENTSRERVVNTLFEKYEVEKLLDIEPKVVFHTSDNEPVYCSYIPFKNY